MNHQALTIYVAARSESKSQTAVEKLQKETGKDCFLPLVMDLGDEKSIEGAAAKVKAGGGTCCSRAKSP